MLDSIIHKFHKLTDSRQPQLYRFHLADIASLVFLGVVAGHDEWDKIWLWACYKFEAGLHETLPRLRIGAGLPSKDTISRVIASIAPAEVCEILSSCAPDFMRRHFELRPGARKADEGMVNLAVDGKTSVGAVPRGMDKSETHIVNAVCAAPSRWAWSR